MSRARPGPAPLDDHDARADSGSTPGSLRTASASTTTSTSDSRGKHSRTRSTGAVVGNRNRTEGTQTLDVFEFRR